MSDEKKIHVGVATDRSVNYKRFTFEEMYCGLPIKITRSGRWVYKLNITTVEQYQEKARYYDN